MKFGNFCAYQLPRPWTERGECGLFQSSLVEVEVADRLGCDYPWEVEHHLPAE